MIQQCVCSKVQIRFHFWFFFLGIRLASLIIPLIINFLPDPISSNLKLNIHLISYITERIQYLLPIYANEFRLIFQTFPDLRSKLENSIHRQQHEKQVNQPTIDFSNFKIN